VAEAATGHLGSVSDQFDPVRACRVKRQYRTGTQYSQAFSCFYIHRAFLIPTTKQF
jgi:hypothetical protein